MLVFWYDVLNYNLTKTFGEVTWKYKFDELINKLNNTLNELINKSDLSVKTTTESSNELLETLKVLENCTSCKDKKINGIEIENCLNELKKEEQGWGMYHITLRSIM